MTNLSCLTISGSGSVYQGDNFYNSGLIRHTNTALLTIDSHSYFRNLPAGIYDFVDDGNMIIHSEYSSYFENYGLLRKSGGAGVSIITGTLKNQGGNVEVDSGTLQLSSYAQNGGTLTIALGGTNSGQSGMLKVDTTATLNGPLNVKFVNGFIPSVGQSFKILSYAILNGNFTATNIPSGISLSYSNSDIYLHVTSYVSRTLVNSTRSGTNFIFSFQTENGGNYTVEYNDILGTTNWQFLKTVTGDGSLMQCLLPMTNLSQRFFRIRQP